ncbi:VOC family protein [Hymenobacter sp. UYP22]|uniref:VOC family protein n=1 Tax=Hymenobacter sp. UYP22 TaxID=3156348 RepID=UPI00339A1F89
MSTPILTPYLTFNGTCRAAMQFYHECLGGELLIQTFAGTPAAEHMPDGAEHNVLHSSLKADGFLLMASDTGMEPVVQGNSVSLSINCFGPEEIADKFLKLSAGGTVTMPLQDTFWGATFGMFTDQFGINWMLNYDKPTSEE